MSRSSSPATTTANEEHDTTTLDLPSNGGGTTSQNDMIAQVAAANPHTIVVLNNNSAINMPWLNQVAGVFEGFYSGQQIGTAMAALIFGDVNPSGKLPVTFPKSLADVPANTPAQWPGTNGSVQYSEGLKVGYRWYDAQNIAPLFPFGYGLSYTNFGYSDLQVGALSGGNATVHATVTNTGSRAGTDVAQLYVGDPASTGEPMHQLRGFQRVTLNPGQSQTVTFTVSTHDLAYWNTASNGWTTRGGQLPDPGRRLLAQPPADRHPQCPDPGQRRARRRPHRQGDRHRTGRHGRAAQRAEPARHEQPAARHGRLGLRPGRRLRHHLHRDGTAAGHLPQPGGPVHRHRHLDRHLHGDGHRREHGGRHRFRDLRLDHDVGRPRTSPRRPSDGRRGRAAFPGRGFPRPDLSPALVRAVRVIDTVAGRGDDGGGHQW